MTACISYTSIPPRLQTLALHRGRHFVCGGDASDPVVVRADVGVDAGVVVVAAANAPRDDPDLHPARRHEQRAARIALARIRVGGRVCANHPGRNVGRAVPKVGAALFTVEQVNVAKLQPRRHRPGVNIVAPPPERDGLAIAAKALVECVASLRKVDRGDGVDGRCKL